MLKMFRSTLRKALPCLVLAVALAATALPAPAVQAAPAAPTAVELWFDGLVDTLEAWMSAPLGVATSSSEAGPGMDPNGIEADAGPGMDPDGLTATPQTGGESDAGPSMDPNG